MNAPNSILKMIVGGVIIFVAAFGGMYLGGILGNKSDNVSASQEDVFTDLKLISGSVFPDTELIDKKYLPVMSKSLLNQDGTVVLFMDDDCPPCSDIAWEWQRKIDEGIIQGSQVMGICFANAAQIHSIHDKYQIDFPIYADERYTFLDYYGVDAFPLVVVLDKSGVIRYVEHDSNKKIDPSELKKLLEG